jgi:prevent-host-death family protein
LTNLTNIASIHDIPNRMSRVAKPVNIYEAKTHLSELVDRAAAGEEIIIAKAGEPMARLVPLRAVHERRVFGRWAGQVSIAADFDAPLPETLLSAFEGDDD